MAGRGPSTWGTGAAKAVEHSVVREVALNPAAASPAHLLDRHFTRKHGPGAHHGNPDRALATRG